MKTTILDVDDENDGTSTKLILINSWGYYFCIFLKIAGIDSRDKMLLERIHKLNGAGVDEDDDPRRRRRELWDLDEIDLNQ